MARTKKKERKVSKAYGVMPSNFVELHLKACDKSNSYTHTQAMKDLNIAHSTYYKYVSQMKSQTSVSEGEEPNVLQRIAKFFRKTLHIA